MKKLLALLMAMMLALPCAAGAEGLGGLGGGGSAGGLGLSGLQPTEAPNPNMGVVPDAANFTGTAKTVLQKNYEYATGLFFTAYTYALPVDVAAFTDAYVAEAEKNGFTVEQLTVEGYDARQITWTDGAYALLVPNFGGQVLLLVQNGMTFGEPKPEGYYIEFEYNGELVRNTSPFNGMVDQIHSRGVYNFSTVFYSPIHYMQLHVPVSVEAGKEYTVRDGSSGFRLSTQVKKDGRIDLLINDSKYAQDGIKDSEDHFTISIISIETITDRIEIEAEFEGRFRYGAIMITNGHFYLAFKRP